MNKKFFLLTKWSSFYNPNFYSFQDHEFIPTRMKQIAASKPAADPKQFTRVPSNPLLVSAQKQMVRQTMELFSSRR